MWTNIHPLWESSAEPRQPVGLPDTSMYGPAGAPITSAPVPVGTPVTSIIGPIGAQVPNAQAIFTAAHRLDDEQPTSVNAQIPGTAQGTIMPVAGSVAAPLFVTAPGATLPIMNSGEYLSNGVAMNRQLSYAGIATSHSFPTMSYFGTPQLNSTFAHPTACMSSHAQYNATYTPTYGGDASLASQAFGFQPVTNVGATYTGTYSSAGQYQPVFSAHDHSGQPHGGSTPTNDSFGRTTYTLPQSHLDISLSQSHVAARQVISKDLPPFSGKPEEWPLFITNYEQSTQRCGFSEQENLIRLQKSLRGAALEAVRGKLMMPSTVHLAIGTLRMLFGRPDVIHDTLQRKLRQIPSVRFDQLDTLINLALAVQNYRATMQAMGLSNYLNDPMLLNELLSKLPGDMKLDWGRRRLITARVDIAAFDEWLFGLASCASQVTNSSLTLSEEKSGRKGSKERVLVHNQVQKERASPKSTSDRSSQSDKVQIVPPSSLGCPKCAKDHNLADCLEFRANSRNERWQLIKDKKLCIRCFKSHLVRHCGSKRVCGVDGCRMAHNPLLHSLGTAAAANNSSEVAIAETKKHDSSTVLFHQRKFKRAVFRYIPVTLYGPDTTVDTFALIDEGASCTLMDNELALQLGLDGPGEELCLKWTGDITQQEPNSKFVSLEISARDKAGPRYHMRNVRTITSLQLPQQSLRGDTLSEREHLKALPILPYRDCRARMLIGLDHAKLCVPVEIHQDESDELIAARCKIGWSVYGRDESLQPPRESLLHICTCTKDNQLDSLMRSYFSVESVGISPTVKPLFSKEDERSYSLMEKTVKYDAAAKRWETGLLWKFDQIDLPESYPMAFNRLQCLERKMNKNHELKKFLIDKIEDYTEKGYVTKLSADEISKGGKSWFIPIFTVMNINKNKRRLVWDAAAKVHGIGLNDALLKGPDLLRSLVGVLLRFRERRVAICGDIREMFHQIRVVKEDQVAQQFLWRDGDSKRQPEVFAMTVMTFGASCSPTLANFIKDKNAIRFKKEHPRAVAAIIRNTFVDDWLHSVDEEDEMVQLATDVHYIHGEGGFEMRHWLSNSTRVLQALTGKSELINKCFEEPGSEYEKVLGMWWLPSTDELTFVQKFKSEVFDESTFPTKRQILRVVMTIFDPLGLLGFFVVKAKMILQDVWRSSVTWDEAVHEQERTAWWQWVRKLRTIDKIRITRCYHLASHSSDNQLHIFVDSSILAYAAVAFLRSHKDGEVRCSLIASKTRVTPLKPISVPRLELMAAILGLRLAKFVQNELSLCISRRVFWSDSKDVLFWIRSDAKKFNQFVAVRVGEILEDSQVCEWRWVPTKDNVADDGTKWDASIEFNNGARWFNGPEFLSLPEDSWPTSEFQKPQPAKEMIHHVKDSGGITLDACPDPKRFSKWERLRGVQMCVLRFLQLTMTTPAKNPITQSIIDDRTVTSSELLLFRKCQQECFREEFEQLKTGRVSRKSTIYKFSPHIDEYGLLRVKGRIDEARGISADLKRPIILPRNHGTTYLITDFYHRKSHHHHSEIVVNEMRQRFCIHGLRALVKVAAKTCQECRNRRATPIPPEMGRLPAERLAAFTHPFAYTGVDYFGPFDVVVGRRHEKRWGVIFTCMTVRAVHIEISPSLSTDSFLLVLKMFISRRGVPRRITSDNATNFRGASRILADEIEKLSSGVIERKHPEIEWVFIPPAAPHMGGAWERMIRSVKSVLMEILPDNNLREEVLRAALAEVENIINMRPLTYIPVDSYESEALTPNHFLLGNSSGIREKDGCDVGLSTLSKNFRFAGELADRFWKRWIREYLPGLTRRAKWFENTPAPIAVDDVVIIVDENAKRNTWVKARVYDVMRGTDGQVRSAVVKTSSGLVTRPVVKLARLDIEAVNPTT